jgi:CheY-like chemotaxis protein
MTKSITPKNLVLYADDDQDDLVLVEQSFSQYSNNVEVITFMDGHNTIRFLEKLPDGHPEPCLIILDINMPGLNGKEVLIRLRRISRFQGTPVVLFTTSSLPLDKEFALRYDAGLITKPLDLKQMELITYQFIDHCDEETKKKIRKEIL